MNSKTIMQDYSTFYIKYIKEKGQDDVETIKTYVYGGERNKEGSEYKDIKEIHDEDIIIRAIIANKIVAEATSIVQANSKLNAAADKVGSKEPHKNINLNVEIDNLLRTYGLSGDFSDIQSQIIQKILSSNGAFSESYPDNTTKESKYKLFLGPNKDLGLAILRYFARKQGFDITNFNVTDDPASMRISIGYTKGPIVKEEKAQPRYYRPGDNDVEPNVKDPSKDASQAAKPDDAQDIIDNLNKRKSLFDKMLESLNETARRVKAVFTGEKHEKSAEPGAPTRSSQGNETEADKLLEQLIEAHKANNTIRVTSILRILENMAGFDMSRVPDEIRSLSKTNKTYEQSANAPITDETTASKQQRQTTGASNDPVQQEQKPVIPPAITFHNEQIKEAVTPEIKLHWVKRRLELPEFQEFLKSVDERLHIAIQNEDVDTIKTCLKTLNDAHTGNYELPSLEEIRQKMIQAELDQDKNTYTTYLKVLTILNKAMPSLGEGSGNKKM